MADERDLLSELKIQETPSKLLELIGQDRERVARGELRIDQFTKGFLNKLEKLHQLGAAEFPATRAYLAYPLLDILGKHRELMVDPSVSLIVAYLGIEWLEGQDPESRIVEYAKRTIDQVLELAVKLKLDQQEGKSGDYIRLIQQQVDIQPLGNPDYEARKQKDLLTRGISDDEMGQILDELLEPSAKSSGVPNFGDERAVGEVDEKAEAKKWADVITNEGRGYVQAKVDLDWKVNGKPIKITTNTKRANIRHSITYNFGDDKWIYSGVWIDEHSLELQKFLEKKDVNNLDDYSLIMEENRSDLKVRYFMPSLLDPDNPITFDFYLMSDERKELSQRIRENPNLIDEIFQAMNPGLVAPDQLQRKPSKQLKFIEVKRDETEPLSLQILPFTKPIEF